MNEIIDTEILYPDVPPTRIRNREEKFRKAKKVPFWLAVADYVFPRMLENRFYALRYRNFEKFTQYRNPKYPCIIYTPHCNWWDGIVCYNLSQRLFKTDIVIMIEEMNRFPLFSYVGAFPVNKKSAQTAMQSLRHAVELLVKDATRKIALWIFPQGIIRPPNYRPIIFQTGMTYIAQKIIKEVGGVNLIGVSLNYSFLREHRPEVIVDVGQPLVLTDENIDRHDFTRELEKSFTLQCDEHLASISKGEFNDYKFLFRQKLPWYRQLEKRLKNIGIARNSSTSPYVNK